MMVSQVQFPNVGLRILSCLIHLLGVSIVSFLFSRRIRIEDFSSLRSLMKTGVPRTLVVLALMDSWAFLFTSSVLIQGAGLGRNGTVCSLAIFNCIAFYASSKILIYFFLVEKIHVVWSPSPRSRRLHSPIYLVCFTFVCLYVIVATVMIIERVAYFRADGTCVIGLKRAASVTLLVYDLFINVLFTSLFLWPLYRATFRSARVRQVAVRTVWAAAVALTTSCINILILTLMHGRQLGWLCLASCGSDVVVNAAVLFWVTSGGSDSRSEASPPQEIHIARQGRSGSLGSRPLQDASHRMSISSSTVRGAADSYRGSASFSAKSVEPGLPAGPSSSVESDTKEVDMQFEKAPSELEAQRETAEDVPRHRMRALFAPVAALFSRPNDDQSTQSIQIAVTTEFDVDHGRTQDTDSQSLKY